MRRLSCFLIILILFLASTSGCNVKKAEDAVSEQSMQQETINSETENYKARVAKKMEELFNFLRQDNYFSGYILIGTENQLIYQGGCGYSDYEKELEINEETKFKVGSIMKQIVATAIMQLQEKGMLDVNDKLSKYIPDFPHSDKITIHHLLTHGSGLETYASNYDIRHYLPGEQKKTATGKKRSNDEQLMFEPGTGFNYSNVGYILLGLVVEKVSGQGIDIYMKNNIFDPLEMTNTGFVIPGTKLDNFAVGYMNGEQTMAAPDKFLFKVDQEESTGFYSCAADLYKWNLALNSGKILKPESQAVMFTKHNNNYGYGWNIYGDPPDAVNFVHDGSSTGYSSKLIKTSEGVSIIILSNYDEIDLSYILDSIIPILVDEEYSSQ